MFVTGPPEFIERQTQIVVAAWLRRAEATFRSLDSRKHEAVNPEPM